MNLIGVLMSSIITDRSKATAFMTCFHGARFFEA